MADSAPLQKKRTSSAGGMMRSRKSRIYRSSGLGLAEEDTCIHMLIGVDVIFCKYAPIHGNKTVPVGELRSCVMETISPAVGQGQRSLHCT